MAPRRSVGPSAALRAAIPRREVVLEETPAPQRLAPYAIAMTADVVVDDEELATGRLVLLHDPAGHETWEGTFRLVTFVRAELEPEIAADPLLPGVGWAWLIEALDAHGATFTRPERHGHPGHLGELRRDVRRSPATRQIEIRASWTPVDDALGPHLLAWADLLVHDRRAARRCRPA